MTGATGATGTRADRHTAAAPAHGGRRRTGGYTGGGGGPARPGRAARAAGPGGGANGNGGTDGRLRRRATSRRRPPPPRKPNGVPTNANPTLTIADSGPAPIGVPSFLISQFEIPPFLLPIYQACGTQYGIPWEVLAAINKIETAFGTNLNVSTAGAVGWMQFMPSTWEAYGVDANGDGRKDPYNPVDAICAAARYLKAAGGDTDLRQRDLRLQPRRLVRRRGAALRAASTASFPRTWSARSPA